MWSGLTMMMKVMMKHSATLKTENWKCGHLILKKTKIHLVIVSFGMRVIGSVHQY